MKEKIAKLLKDLIRIPSTRGNEGDVNRYLYSYLKDKCTDIELINVSDSIMTDPDYSFPIEKFSYKNTPNLCVKIKGTGKGKSVVFNTHVDVVPPSQGQNDAFSPKELDGVVYGRGACDAKGQVATLVALIELIYRDKVKLNGDLEFHFVFEEESGGNGTLAMIRRGCKADAAIVLEPTEFAVIPSVRGAVWFDITVYGKSGHSGRAGDTVSAIKKAYEVIDILERYHDKLLIESRGGNRLFDVFENPMPVTFGILNSGNWPATTPAKAELKGVFGFLPNRNRKEIMEGMKKEIYEQGSDWLKNNFEIKFNMLHSDGNVIPEDHPLVVSLVDSVKKNNYPGNITAMTASCDAWLYNNQLKIPTVVFGPGSLKYAHSAQEQIKISEIIDASKILLDFVTNFCR